MRPSIFHPEAEAEMLHAADFYENQASGLGVEFLRHVEQTVAQIQEHPEAGSKLTPTIRRRLVRRFPFSVLYEIKPTHVHILAVMHQRRKPGYWRDRA